MAENDTAGVESLRTVPRKSLPVWARPLAMPQHVTVFVNWVCNLRCRECWLYGDSQDENDWLREAMRDTISTELFAGLVDELLAESPTTSISLMGGEPLVHRELPELVGLLKRRSPESYIDVSTNGTLVKRHGEALLEAGIDQVYFSLDGSCPEINDPIRGEGSFDKAMEGVRYYLERQARYPKTRMSLNFTITALNYRDLAAMVVLAESLGVQELSVNFTMFFSEQEGNAAAPKFSAVLDRPFTSWRGFLNHAMGVGVRREDLAAVLEEAHRRVRTIRLLVAPLRYSLDERSQYFEPAWKGVVQERSCPRLTFQTTVLPNGDVLSCTPFADTVMGNLKESSLAEIWHGERYRALRGLLAEGLTEICHRCCDLNNDMDLDAARFLRTRAAAAG